MLFPGLGWRTVEANLEKRCTALAFGDFVEERQLALDFRKVDTAENCIRDWVNDCSSQNMQMDVLVDTIEGVAGYLCSEEGRDGM